jgi:transcriptional regulator with XRE-family HTH domain
MVRDVTGELMKVATMGDRLTCIRKVNGRLQREVAECIGVSVSTLSSYESSTSYPRADTLVKLSCYYGVSVEYLLFGAEAKKKAHRGGEL